MTGPAGEWAGALFVMALLNGSIIGAGAVTLSASYAIGDVSGTKHSLHRTWRDAPKFHGSYAALVVLAATIVLIPKAPLGILTTGVQALADVLLPSALVFLLLLRNNRAVLGPWVNTRWLNVIAATVVAVLLVLSGLLTISTLVPRAENDWLVTAILVISAGVLGVLFGLRLSSQDAASPPGSNSPGKPVWTMPSIETLPPPVRSPHANHRTRNPACLPSPGRRAGRDQDSAADHGVIEQSPWSCQPTRKAKVTHQRRCLTDDAQKWPICTQ